MFLIDLTNCSKSDCHLNILNQLMISTEKCIQCILPNISTLISWRNSCDFCNQILRIMLSHSIDTLFHIYSSCWCIDEKWILVQFVHINCQHWFCGILCVDDILEIAVLHYKSQICLSAKKHIIWSHLFT